MKKKSYLLLLVAAIGVGVWLLPHSDAIPEKGWGLFALFLSIIVGIVLKPLPLGALSIIGMSVATLTGLLSLEEVLAGFHNEIAWLVLLAFFISLGFTKTGLGNRIAYAFVSVFGKKSLTLSYGLLFSELMLAPAIPSVTARAGGVIFPIVQGLAKTFDSDPEKGTERKIGSFLIKVAYQGSVISSAMFLTAMAANPFLAGLTEQAGYNLSWGKWALAAIVPGVISLLLMPWIVYKVYPPQMKDTPSAPEYARLKLKEMGPLKNSEWLMLGVFILLLFLWVFGSWIGMKATVAALIGLSLMLIFGVLDWKDVLNEDKAWDTFIWFATLIMLATALNRLGFTPWVSQQMVGIVGNWSWVWGFSLLFFVYFYSHYFFVSNTAHVGAMFPAFLLVAIGLGTPPYLAILSLAFASNLFGGLTHYGSGPAPLYFGSGYVDIKSWWSIGALLSVINILIWVGLGSLWWKVLGFW